MRATTCDHVAVRRTLPALMLLGLAVCDSAELSLDLDGGARCAGIALEVVDEPLPGWKIAAMVAEEVEGEGAWIVAEDPEGRTMLQPWPAGEGLDLSELGAAQEFDLQPGLLAGESWLVLDRPERARVWRLGPAASGVVHEVPGLADFPGPGEWTRRLLFVGHTPHLLAAPVTTLEAVPRFQVAAIEPATLTLGPVWPVDLAQTCWGDIPEACLYLAGDSVEMLAVTAAGSMKGGAVLIASGSLTVEFATGRDAVLSTLALYVSDEGAAPIAQSWFGSLLPGSGSHQGRLQGQLATDTYSLFSAARLVRPEIPPGELQLEVVNLNPAAAGRPIYSPFREVSALLQLGDRAVVGEFAEGRLSLAPIGGPTIDRTVTGNIELDPDAQVTSVGREQLLLRPTTGPARRVRARCMPAE